MTNLQQKIYDLKNNKQLGLFFNDIKKSQTQENGHFTAFYRHLDDVNWYYFKTFNQKTEFMIRLCKAYNK